MYFGTDGGVYRTWNGGITLEITENLNYFPSLVIVNVTKNDIANDFSYPHTTIIEGFMFGDVHLVEINDII